jgi:hypothetical protein
MYIYTHMREAKSLPRVTSKQEARSGELWRSDTLYGMAASDSDGMAAGYSGSIPPPSPHSTTPYISDIGEWWRALVPRRHTHYNTAHTVLMMCTIMYMARSSRPSLCSTAVHVDGLPRCLSPSVRLYHRSTLSFGGLFWRYHSFSIGFSIGFIMFVLCDIHHVRAV